MSFPAERTHCLDAPFLKHVSLISYPAGQWLERADQITTWSVRTNTIHQPGPVLPREVRAGWGQDVLLPVRQGGWWLRPGVSLPGGGARFTFRGARVLPVAPCWTRAFSCPVTLLLTLVTGPWLPLGPHCLLLPPPLRMHLTSQMWELDPKRTN